MSDYTYSAIQNSPVSMIQRNPTTRGLYWIRCIVYSEYMLCYFFLQNRRVFSLLNLKKNLGTKWVWIIKIGSNIPGTSFCNYSRKIILFYPDNFFTAIRPKDFAYPNIRKIGTIFKNKLTNVWGVCTQVKIRKKQGSTQSRETVPLIGVIETIPRHSPFN